MIFKSKKAFDEEVYKRMSEIDFRERIDNKLFRLEEEVNNLRHVVNRLEDRLNVPQPQPCIVKPSWTGTDPVAHTGYTTAGGEDQCTT